MSNNTLNLGLVSPTDSTSAGTAAPWVIQVSMSDRPVQSVAITNNTVRGANRGITTLSQRSATSVSITENIVDNVIDGIVLNAGSVPPQTAGVTMGITVTGNTVAASVYAVFARALHNAAPNGPVVFDDLIVEDNVVNAGVVQIGRAETFVPAGATGPGNGLVNTQGDSTIDGSSNNDVLQAENSGNITFFGLGGDDSLSSGAGNDTLYGEAGDDQLDGNDGDDRIHGGTGNDDNFDDERLLDDKAEDAGDNLPSGGKVSVTAGAAKASVGAIRFAADGSATIVGTSGSRRDKQYFAFTAAANGALAVSVARDASGRYAELEIEDAAASRSLLELRPRSDATNSGRISVAKGRRYVLELRSQDMDPVAFVSQLQLLS